MRVLLLDQYSELGGGQRCLIEAAAGFAARGWEVHAAVPAPESDQGPLAAGLALYCRGLHPMPCGPFAFTRKSSADALRYALQLPAQVAVLRRILRRARGIHREIDVLYANGPRVLPAAAMARGATPLVFHAHWDVTQPGVSALVTQSARFGRATIIASSRSVARPLERVIPKERIRVVYNGVSVTRAAAAREPRTIRKIAMLGRIAPEKGQLEFVRSARLVSEIAPEAIFSIHGASLFAENTYEPRVRAEAAGYPIEFPGWTEDTSGVFADMDLLVVPSDPTDNIPRVILEAFAARVPVIAFPSGGIPELIEDRVTGLLVRDRAPANLARAILDAMGRPEEMRAMAERAFEAWREHYTLERFQSQVCEVVEDIVRRNHQRAPRTTASVDPAA